MRLLSFRLLAMIGFIVLVGVIGVLGQEYGSLDWFVQNEYRLRDSISEQPVQFWLLGLAAYWLFSMVPGRAGKSVGVGWLFGFWQAVLMVDLALTAAAIVSFSAARFVIGQQVTERFGPLIRKINRGLENDGAFYLLTMRMAHMPFTFVNYGAGTTTVSYGTFAWTTMVGLLPGTMIFVFVGTRIPTLAVLAEHGVWPLLDPLLFALLAATVCFPWLVRWSIRGFPGYRTRSQRLAQDESRTTRSHTTERHPHDGC